MTTKAQELLAEAGKTAARMFRDMGEVPQMFHMVREDGEYELVGAPLGDQEQKDRVAEVVRDLLRARGIVRYAFITEAWMVVAAPETHPADAKLAMSLARAGRLAEHHERVEVLMIHVEDRDTREFLTRQYRILRPEHGKPTLKPAEDMDMTHAEGRFVRMFDKPSKGD